MSPRFALAAQCGTDHIDVQSLAFAKVSCFVRTHPSCSHTRPLHLAPNRLHQPDSYSSASAGPIHSHPTIHLRPAPSPHPTAPQLANPDTGRIKTQYRRVECTPPGDMQISVMDFRGAGGWIRLTVDVSALPADCCPQAAAPAG